MYDGIADPPAKGLRRRIPASDFYCAAVVATLTTAFQTYWLVIELTKPVGDVEVLRSPFIPRMLMLIWLCLLVSTVALWTRRLAGLLVSMIGLAGVLGGYFLWHVYTSQMTDILLKDTYFREHPEDMPTLVMGLMGASWWNGVVLVLAGMLFLWETKTLIGMRRAH